VTSFLLSLLLAKVTAIGVPILLLAVAGYCLFRRETVLASIAACIAAGWLACGLVYQEGVTAERARWEGKVDAEVARKTSLLVARLQETLKQNELTQDEMDALVKERDGLVAQLAGRPSCTATSEEEGKYAPLIPAR
jgi:hypothetical protein